MNTRELLIQIRDSGYPMAVLAKKINKAPSTIQKWVNGSSQYLAKETEFLLRQEIKKLKEFWVNLQV